MEGIVLKAYGGFFYVSLVSGEVRECKLPGKFRYQEQDVLPGDRVEVNEEGSTVTILEVKKRLNCLLRPAIANVDRAVLVVSLEEPDQVLLDRQLILAEEAGVSPLIYFNKYDLYRQRGEQLLAEYQSYGYRALAGSALLGDAVLELADELQKHTSVLAGPSGVGKSSLLNALLPQAGRATAEVSLRTRRGRHTTRHVELLPLPGGGLIADTPGFSRLSLPDLPREELMFFFPEFEPYLNRCRFHTCLHRQEPDCTVRQAVEKGLLSRQRYQHYLDFLVEVIQRERSF